MDIKRADQQYIANTYKRTDVLFVEGKGAVLKDETGKAYIDLGSGIAVNTFGIADDAWIDAVTTQLQRLQHVSNLYYTEPQVLLAKKLCERSGLKKVFFGNSGAEANECMIKAARKYSVDKYGAGRHTIVTLNHSFHGRTITTLAATGQPTLHQYFQPFTDGFVYAEPDDDDGLLAMVEAHNPCAIMLEPIQGEGGVHALDKAYVQRAAKLCQEKDILLLFDEVQSGNGRTGKLYAYMHYDVLPDIVSTAKGLGGGLPISATLFGEKTQATLAYGSHGSTFGGNPISAAGALNVIDRLDDALLAEVGKKSNYIFERLRHAEGVISIDGMGLMIGIETKKDAAIIAARCLELGVVVLTAHGKVRLLPPLTIPDDLLATAIDRLISALQ